MNTEKELTHELHGRADRIDGSPISFDQVVGRAGRIKRNRRLTTGVATLAAAAIIVPTAMFGGSLFDNDAAPGPVAPDTQQVHDAVLDPTLPEGDPPKLAYVDADKLVQPDGTTVDLGKNYGAPRRAGDEYLGASGFEDEPSIDVFDQQWQVVDSVPFMNGPVSSADGSVAAWIATDGTVVTRFGGRSVDLGKVEGSYLTPVAILGHDSCMEVDGGCRVFVNVQDGKPVSADSHGIVDVVPGDFTNVAAVSTDNLIVGVVTPISAPPTDPVCSAVYDEQAMKRLFKTCDLAFGYSAGFSPDNSLLGGYHSDTDGAGPRSMTVVDARTGDKVLGIDLDTAIEKNTSIVGADWEDDDHLLIHTEGPGTANKVSTHNLYRVGLDGSVERLLERDYDNGTMTAPWLMLQP
ncbi:hypothetical protein [Nocardioides sp. Soil796]|uniref:hypothetical protein n=1 Tax=Nocardioides sp. Soil796 TaxID=1736412 RepID=UPI00070B9AF4|nr:hypothetical protein [Nocardioides sp. Soil796]KRF14408.1 hypothetical protein ASH02_08715 [Nocardioides sp. Soil796]